MRSVTFLSTFENGTQKGGKDTTRVTIFPLTV